MNNQATFSVLDLFDLTPDERALFLEIARGGAQSIDALAQATTLSPEILRRALDALVAQKRIICLPDGTYDVVMGKTKPHTTLPAQLWPALLAPQRLYSDQEIAILKVAIPMLQFVRATLSSFADHGPHHALRVKTFATQLGYAMGLTDTERRLLRVAALFHDIGNVIERERHHQISQETVEKLVEQGELPLTPEEANVVGLLCRWHRKEYEPEHIDRVRGETVRTGLAASILRVSDAMDIDSRRSDYDEQFRFAMEFFFPEKRQYFTSLEETYGVRVVCASNVNLQVFTRGVIHDNIQIEQLYGDLSKTPLAWQISQIAIPQTTGASGGAAHTRTDSARALLVFPFDAHSLIMAALSRKQLERAGYQTECFCFPDTSDGAGWLWRTALNEFKPSAYAALLVIGDRPDAASTGQSLETLTRWENAGAYVHVLNRHEANWTRVPELRARGVTVTLGTDWAYFWGDDFSPEDFGWATIAALITRDPTMASSVVSSETERVLRGFLCKVLDLSRCTSQDASEWLARAEPLLERIAQNDRAFFAARADEFMLHYAVVPQMERCAGRVMVFECMSVEMPQALFWQLEAAIEKQGFVFERELRLAAPYAIATYMDDDMVQLVAINHWRAHDVPPIRLLYPDIGPRPQGTESAITVRLSPAQAKLVLEKLLEVCNQ